MKGEPLKSIAATLAQVKEALSRHKLKKFIALVLSIALWFYVMGEQNPTIEDSYRVKIHPKSTSYEYKASYETQEAKVTLSAPRSYFIEYSENDIHAYVDIAEYGEGEYDVPIEASFPRGFELISISPKDIHVKIEPIIERQMALQLIVSGSPKPNTIITNIQSPQNVTVIGPKSTVDSIQKVLGYVGVVGEGEDFELNVPLSAVDENGREVTTARVAPSSVNVVVQIEDSVKKSVPIVADVTAPTGKEISKLTVEPDTVEIEGVAGAVDSVDSVSTVAATIPDEAKTYDESLKLILPEGVKAAVDEVFVTAELKTVSSS